MHLQERALRDGVDIVTATPGRLLDYIRRNHADFRDLQVLVLDEADRMLDMGFLPDVRQIVSTLPKKRQTLLFSATIPREVEQLARQIMQEPFRVTAGLQDQPPESIRHTVYPVQEHLKTGLLIELLRRGGIKSALVFTRTKWRANRLAQSLCDAVPRPTRKSFRGKSLDLRIQDIGIAGPPTPQSRRRPLQGIRVAY